jgi:6-phosphogluconolactonase
LYERLATIEFSQRLNWEKINIFWGDDRCVPPHHIESNYRMVKESLLDYASIPEENIHRIRGELRPAIGAKDYEDALKEFFVEQPPRFDLILLGMGKDGHTASLFPGTSAIQETKRWVTANYVDEISSWRITLTPVIINQASNVIFLVTGAEKAKRVRQVLWGRYQPEVLPAQIVRPHHGHLTWMLDEQAANLL